MMTRSHRMLTAAALSLFSFSPCLALADSGDAAAQGQNGAQMAMARSASASSLPTAQLTLTAAVPSVRKLDADAETTGSEPDPEAFDGQGLDHWWQHHQQPYLPGDRK
jgi:hypothetical protein